MDVIIVCHTEYGLVKDRKIAYRKDAFEGVTKGARNLASIADRHGAKVTFAVMPEVADHFPGDVVHEMGMHIHPGWEKHSSDGLSFFVGDSYLKAHSPMPRTSSVLPDYTYEQQLAMINTGRDYLEDTFGHKPKVFVAGRWSVNNDTIRALVHEGFTHDCSAVPHKRPAHYDWSRLPRICMPYRPSGDDYQRKGDMPLLVVPVSQSLLGASASPELAPLVGLPWLISCFEEYYRQQMPLFHLCLHSPSMTDPYFMEVMDRLLGFIAAQDVTFRFASEVREYSKVRPGASLLPYLGGINRDLLNACPAIAAKIMSRGR